MKLAKFKASTIVITVLLTVMSGMIIVQSLQIAALTGMLAQQKKENVWNTKLIYACYNYKIYPCEDKSVDEWNKQNPDKAITETYLRDPNYGSD